MANAYVNSVGANWFGGGGTSQAATLTGVTAANLLVIAVAWSNNQTIATIAGNSNTYVSAGSPLVDGTSGTLALYYVKSATAGSTTVTVTWSADPGVGMIVIHEYSGHDTSAPLDQYLTVAQFNAGTGANACTSGAVTTTTNGQIIFGVTFDRAAAGGTETGGTGFTRRTNAGEGATEDQIQTSAGSIAATFTLNTGFTTQLNAVVTFKAAGGAETITMDKWAAKIPDVIRRKIGVVPSGTIGIKA